MPVSAKVARALGRGGEMRSLDLSDVRAHHSFAASTLDFRRIAADGFTSVTAYLCFYVDSPTSSVVKTGTLTPSDADLRTVASPAAANGLDVHFMVVLLDNATTPTAAPTCPTNTDGFFASYTASLLHSADLAEALKVTLFYVGSEDKNLARNTSKWLQVIALTRKHFTGALSYMCTFHSSGDVKFWWALDLASISPSEDKVARYPRLMQAWNQVNLQTVNWLAAPVKVPLVFAEIGTCPEPAAPATPPATACRERCPHRRRSSAPTGRCSTQSRSPASSTAWRCGAGTSRAPWPTPASRSRPSRPSASSCSAGRSTRPAHSWQPALQHPERRCAQPHCGRGLEQPAAAGGHLRHGVEVHARGGAFWAPEGRAYGAGARRERRSPCPRCSTGPRRCWSRSCPGRP